MEQCKCGGVARIVIYANERYAALCSGCQFMVVRSTKEKARAAWNAKQREKEPRP